MKFSQVHIEHNYGGIALVGWTEVTNALLIYAGAPLTSETAVQKEVLNDIYNQGGGIGLALAVNAGMSSDSDEAERFVRRVIVQAAQKELGTRSICGRDMPKGERMGWNGGYDYLVPGPFMHTSISIQRMIEKPLFLLEIYRAGRYNHVERDLVTRLTPERRFSEAKEQALRNSRIQATCEAIDGYHYIDLEKLIAIVRSVFPAQTVINLDEMRADLFEFPSFEDRPPKMAVFSDGNLNVICTLAIRNCRRYSGDSWNRSDNLVELENGMLRIPAATGYDDAAEPKEMVVEFELQNRSVDGWRPDPYITANDKYNVRAMADNLHNAFWS